MWWAMLASYRFLSFYFDAKDSKNIRIMAFLRQ